MNSLRFEAKNKILFFFNHEEEPSFYARIISV